MKLARFTAALWAACLCAGSALAAGTLDKIKSSNTILVGYRDSSVPFSYLDGDKKPIGYSIDLCMKVVEAVKKELKLPGLHAKMVPVSSASRLPALLGGDIDLECGTTTSTSERRKQVAFTIPTFIAGARLLAKADSGINGIYNLAGRTVVTTRGTTSEKFFEELNREQTLRAQLVLARDHGESFSFVETGKADAFIMDDVLLYSLRASSKQPADYVVTKDLLTIEPLAIMLRKDDASFKKLVDREITRLIIDNEIHAIYRKWFQSPIPPNGINLNLPMSHLLRDSFKAPTDWLPN